MTYRTESKISAGMPDRLAEAASFYWRRLAKLGRARGAAQAAWEVALASLGVDPAPPYARRSAADWCLARDLQQAIADRAAPSRRVTRRRARETAPPTPAQ